MALSRNEFNIIYQPQIELENNNTTGVEALIRWHHPDLGKIPPSIFIPMAEENGLIHKIGDWVIRTACSQKKIA
ncbi:MAG: EAL domain-containing protein [Candidatus Thiodiazotropha sp.]